MDFNAIVTAALTAAVEQATAPLAARVTELEQQLRIKSGELAALTERTNVLMGHYEKSNELAVQLRDAKAGEALPFFETVMALRSRIDSFGETLGLRGGQIDMTETELKAIKDRLADLTVVLGAVYSIDDLQAAVDAIKAGNFDGLELAEQMRNRITDIAVAHASETLEQHTKDYDHDSIFTEPGELIDFIVNSNSAVRQLADSIEGEIDSNISDRRVKQIVEEVIEGGTFETTFRV